MKGIGHTSLRDLARLRAGQRRRESSWARNGGNWDSFPIAAGETLAVADIAGAGLITHIWMTFHAEEEHFLRKLVLRMYWDGEEQPSVETPLGDFFGMGHAIMKPFISLPLQMLPKAGRGFNCWFPMPFERGARITVANEGAAQVHEIYYYVDYERHDAIEPDLGRFHACWRRENPTVKDNRPSFDWNAPHFDGKGNYVILEAEGRGHYVGCNLNIDQPRPGWYGEGDDMIFIDGDALPTINGTGTEDYFNTAFCPNVEHNAPYSGLSFQERPDFSGKTTLYRFHIEDPVMFARSIRVTLEHGHANGLENDYSSTAYWYQTEPHKAFAPLPPVANRLPGIRPAPPQ